MKIDKTFGLLVIGDELLSGRRQDKHFAKVVEILKARGLKLSWMHCLGDDPKRLTEILRWAFSTGDCVFSCGGIGSTPDDFTRQSAAQALGVEMELHPEAKALILERAQEMAEQDGEPLDLDSQDIKNRLQMGVFPQGARIIPNPYNKIPGFSVKEIHFMPGFPVMAWPMIEWVLDHEYADFTSQGHWAEHSIVVFGGREAALTPLMIAIEKEFPVVRIFSLPSVDHPLYGAHIELGVKGEEGQAQLAFERMKELLKKEGGAIKLGPELS